MPRATDCRQCAFHLAIRGLFAVFFWTSLWGIAGTFIGVPIVIAIPTICKQYQSGRWIADLFGGTSNEA